MGRSMKRVRLLYLMQRKKWGLIKQRVIREKVGPNPFLQYWKGGVKGAYEVKKISNGVYVRLDVPGVKCADDFVVQKKKKLHKHILLFRATSEVLPQFKNFRRTYYGVIAVECQSAAVDVTKTLLKGCCRLMIMGVTNASLVCFNTLTLSSLCSTFNKMKHDDWECECQKVGEQPRGVLIKSQSCETKLKAVDDGSGKYFMYFRMDMPDCIDMPALAYLDDRSVIIKGEEKFTDSLDTPGGRTFMAELSIGSTCCWFVEQATYDKIQLEHGVCIFESKMYCQGSSLCATKNEDRMFVRYPFEPSSNAECSTSK